ncbi:relaxase/mobilization nuclease domain-containing protein [Vibrio diazotrophicus]|uniref:relaxase/mobilization nuclease domain-containing protein n=1 Tax=Vibrio diazotrophicus TaxID=685 RepID=UPI0022B05D2D|nr:relaxase/mobilization nuclease domain-containing protein [Vibrio diazotrophicus]MCZ4370580.1 relaxase/mobilization nuclease domain-containing protein [Vibrio diazotrophicus]
MAIHKIFETKTPSKKQSIEDQSAATTNYAAGTTKVLKQCVRVEYASGKFKPHEEDDIISEKTEFLMAHNISSPLPILKTPHLKVHEMDWSDIGREIANYKSKTGMQKPTSHRMISLQKGEQLDLIQWRKLVKKYMRRVGLQNTKYIVFIHHDTDHSHVHINCGTIDLKTKKIVNEWQNYLEATKVMREIENEFGLGSVANPGDKFNDRAENSKLKPIHITPNKKTKGGDKAQIRRKLDFVLEQNSLLDVTPTFSVFLEQLEAVGVQVRLSYKTQTDKLPNGISYRLSKPNKARNKTNRPALYFPSSKMGHGNEYSLKNLLNNGRFTMNESDSQSLKQLNIRESKRTYGITKDPIPMIDGNNGNLLNTDDRYCNVVLRFRDKDFTKISRVVKYSNLRAYLQLYNEKGSREYDSKLHGFVFRIRINQRWHKESYSQSWFNSPKMTRDEYSALVNQRLAELLIEFIETLLRMLGFGSPEINVESHLGDYQKQSDFHLKRNNGLNTVHTIPQILDAIQDAGASGHIQRYQEMREEQELKLTLERTF